jgi:hypothetical protein
MKTVIEITMRKTTRAIGCQVLDFSSSNAFQKFGRSRNLYL